MSNPPPPFLSSQPDIFQTTAKISSSNVHFHNEFIAKGAACIQDFSGLSPSWVYLPDTN